MRNDCLWAQAALPWEMAKVKRIEDAMQSVKSEYRKLQEQRRQLVNRAAWRRYARAKKT